MTNRVDVQYFSQTMLWGQPVHEQVMVAQDIIKLIPSDVVTILDAGCGNGAVTNDLSKSWDVLGCDISEAALKNVSAPSVVADLCNLPFNDACFDLVLASDVIEHLPDEIYRQALKELARLSKKYVLIAVPYREILEAAQVTCPACGCRYHAHLHQRIYTEDDLDGLLGAEFSTERMLLSGEHWKYSAPSLVSAYRELTGLDYPFENAVCPSCSTRRGSRTEEASALQIGRKIDALQAMQTFYDFEPLPYRSEIIALYCKDGQGGARISPEIPSKSDSVNQLEVACLPLLKDPINYPDREYSVITAGEEKLIFLKKSPKVIEIIKGSLAGLDFYSFINQCYFPAQKLTDNLYSIDRIAFGISGFLIKLKESTEDLVLQIVYQEFKSRDEILHVCFQELRASSQSMAKINEINELAESIEARRSELEIKLQTRDEDYKALQEKLDATNKIANELEIERVRLNNVIETLKNDKLKSNVNEERFDV